MLQCNCLTAVLNNYEFMRAWAMAVRERGQTKGVFIVRRQATLAMLNEERAVVLSAALAITQQLPCPRKSQAIVMMASGKFTLCEC